MQNLNKDYQNIDCTFPTGPWKFDSEVTRVFDNMLERSVPNYRVMREAVFEVGNTFISSDPLIVDIGASRGESIAPFVELLGNKGRFIAVESSPPMAKALRDRFSDSYNVQIREEDARTFKVDAPVDLALSVLTLHFIPIEHRQRVVKTLYESLRPGGGLILVEKILGKDLQVNDLMVNIYHNLKIANGYSREAVDRKALALEGVLVPVTCNWNEELLISSGFTSVECFWRWMNFSAWVAIK